MVDGKFFCFVFNQFDLNQMNLFDRTTLRQDFGKFCKKSLFLAWGNEAFVL